MTSAKPSEKAKNPEQNNSEEKNIEFTKTEEGQKHIIDIVQKDLLQTKSQEKNQQIGYLQLILSCFFGILIIYQRQ